MALVVHLIPGAPHRIDGLCPNCWHATIWQVAMYTFTDHGGPSTHPTAVATICVDCRARVTPV